MAPAAASRPSTIGWELPPFYCPLPDPGVHPAMADLDEQALAWADRFELYPNDIERAWARAIHNADFVCRIMPNGREQIMLLFVEWNYWAWAIDDWHDTSTAPIASADIIDHSVRVLHALRAGDPAMLRPNRLTAALDDLIRRTRADFTPYELWRLSAGIRDWLLGAGWQNTNTEKRAMPTLSDYAAMRVSINGTRFSLTFSEVANNVHLPPDTHFAAPLQALTDAAGFIVSCDNDLFSYAMDDHLDPPSQNLINVIAHHAHCTPRQALPPAVAIRDRAMTLFITLREQLAEHADPQLQRYLEALAHYIRGCIQWMNAAPRYASPRNRYTHPILDASYNITWRTTPSDPGTKAPEIPAIAWWWNELETA